MEKETQAKRCVTKALKPGTAHLYASFFFFITLSSRDESRSFSQMTIIPLNVFIISVGLTICFSLGVTKIHTHTLFDTNFNLQKGHLVVIQM